MWAEEAQACFLCPAMLGRESKIDRGTDRKRTKANKPWIFFPLRCNEKAREENEFLLGTRIV